MLPLFDEVWVVVVVTVFTILDYWEEEDDPKEELPTAAAEEIPTGNDAYAPGATWTTLIIIRLDAVVPLSS